LREGLKTHAVAFQGDGTRIDHRPQFNL